MKKFQGKVALVTGASRGIGRAIAYALAEEGAYLAVTARQNTDRLRDLGDVFIIKMDFSDRKSIDSLVNQVIAKFGKVDILVNSAGIFKQTDFESISEEELDNMLNVDFTGPFLLIQKVFTYMKKRKSGKIIIISSGAGKMGSSKAVHYAAAKAALISITKSLARLAGPYGINVNSVAPGFIETDMISEMLSKKRNEIESMIPLGRLGTPLDVVKTVLFLASSESDYITGQTICVDGGHCMF